MDAQAKHLRVTRVGRGQAEEIIEWTPELLAQRERDKLANEEWANRPKPKTLEEEMTEMKARVAALESARA